MFGGPTHSIASGVMVAWLALPPSAPKAAFIVGQTDVAFASRRDGNWEIYRMDATGQNQRRLTHRDAEDRFPLWSPDRQQIAFVSQVGRDWELWLMNADGTNQRRIASAIVPKSTRGWSADGNIIAF